GPRRVRAEHRQAVLRDPRRRSGPSTSGHAFSGRRRGGIPRGLQSRYRSGRSSLRARPSDFLAPWRTERIRRLLAARREGVAPVAHAPQRVLRGIPGAAALSRPDRAARGPRYGPYSRRCHAFIARQLPRTGFRGDRDTDVADAARWCRRPPVPDAYERL